jgi:hypothetical protein
MLVIKRILTLAALGGLFALPACTSNQAAVEPQKTTANTAASELQFQVGTATYGGNIFLNTVVSFRQPNGLSALLDNTPSISLPFTNTAPASVGPVIFAANDSGTNRISGTPQTNNGQPSTDPRTFPQTVGAFAYGFLASNSSTTGVNNSVFYPSASGSTEANRSPYYGAAFGITQRAFYVGPPFTANFKDGSLGTTFLGYPNGFTTFAITPTTGTYTLTVGLPNASTPVPTFPATTTLASLAVALPPQTAPSYATDGAGGGTVTVTTPAGASETAVFIRDLTAAGSVVAYYTIVVHGAGAHTVTLPDNLGTITGGVAAATIPPGDLASLVAVSFDYPAMEAVPIGAGPPQAPVINNAGTACTFSGTSSTCPGQADVTVSGATTVPE